MTALIEDIQKLQTLKGLSDTQLATALDIDLSTWSKIKNGHRPPGGNFLKAIMRTFPELHLAVLDYMAKEEIPSNGNGNKEAGE